MVNVQFYNDFYKRGGFLYDCNKIKSKATKIYTKYKLSRNMMLLDLGCGRGEYAVAFSTLGLISYAVDISYEGVNHGLNDIKSLSSTNHEKIYLINGDAYNLPFKKDIFDIIFINEISIYNRPNINDKKSINFTESLFSYLASKGKLLILYESTLSNKWDRTNKWFHHNLDAFIDHSRILNKDIKCDYINGTIYCYVSK